MAAWAWPVVLCVEVISTRAICNRRRKTWPILECKQGGSSKEEERKETMKMEIKVKLKLVARPADGEDEAAAQRGGTIICVRMQARVLLTTDI